MSLKIVFLLAFLTVVFGLPSPSKKQAVEISKETLRGLPLSGSKKPFINIPKKNPQLQGKQANDPSEGLNDEISNEALRGLPLSVLKKPLVTIPKRNQPILGKQVNHPSEALNDDIDQADYDEINEEIESVPLRMKRATCRNVTFRTKSGKTLTVYRCTK